MFISCACSRVLITSNGVTAEERMGQGVGGGRRKKGVTTRFTHGKRKNKRRGYGDCRKAMHVHCSSQGAAMYIECHWSSRKEKRKQKEEKEGEGERKKNHTLVPWHIHQVVARFG